MKRVIKADSANHGVRGKYEYSCDLRNYLKKESNDSEILDHVLSYISSDEMIAALKSFADLFDIDISEV